MTYHINPIKHPGGIVFCERGCYLEHKVKIISHCQNSSNKQYYYTFRESNSTTFWSPSQESTLTGKNFLLKDQFFSSLKVDPISKSYFIRGSKQNFIQVNTTVFLEKRQGALIRAGAFIRAGAGAFFRAGDNY